MDSNHAVTSLTDLLGRLSLQCAHRVSTMQTRPPLCRPCLRYADRASAMQTMPPLCSKKPTPYSLTEQFLKKKNFLCVIKNCNNFFLT